MKIWKIKLDANNFKSFCYINKDDFKKVNLQGISIKNSWTNIHVCIDNIQKKLQTPDIFNLLTKTVINKRAFEELRNILENKVELLPVIYQHEEYYLMNVLNVLDCLDMDKSKVIMLSENKIMFIDKYYFKYDIIKNEDIFLVMQHRIEILISDRLKNKIESRNLKGLQFEEVWDSDKPYEEEPEKPAYVEIIDESYLAWTGEPTPLEEEHILAVEKYFGIRYPEDFRSFIIHNNGAKPEEYLIMSEDKLWDVMNFINLNPEVKRPWYIIDSYESIKEQFPKERPLNI